jgi:O-antigen/teichoic acid export membrane protein
MFFAKIKTLSKQSLIYGLGYVLSRFLSFLLMPYFSHYMPPEEYGAYALIYIFIPVVQIIYIGGLDIAFLRYYVGEKGEEQKTVYSNAFLSMLIIGSFFTLVFYIFPGEVANILFKNPPQNSALWIRIASGILLLETLNIVPFLKLRGDQKPTLFGILRIVNVAINIVANIYFVGKLHWGLTGALYANLISSASIVAFFIPSIISYIRLHVDFKVQRELWIFGIPNVPAMFFYYVIEFSGRKIIEASRGLEEAGLYSAGYKMGMFMAIITSAFRFAWQPFFLAEAKNEGAERTFARIFTYFFIASALLFMLFVMFAGDLVMMELPIIHINILDPSYWEGMAVFPIILLAHFFDGLYANFTVGVYVKKKTKLIPVVIGSGALFNILANILIIPRFGMMGAAWVTLGSFVIMAGLQLLLIDKHYHIPYEWSRVGKFALCWAVVMIVYYFYPGNFLWRLLLIGLIFPALFALKFFNQTEKGRMMALLLKH